MSASESVLFWVVLPQTGQKITRRIDRVELLIFGEARAKARIEQVLVVHGEVGGGALSPVREDGETIHGILDHDAGLVGLTERHGFVAIDSRQGV